MESTRPADPPPRGRTEERLSQLERQLALLVDLAEVTRLRQDGVDDRVGELEFDLAAALRMLRSQRRRR